jgi:AcrR family transcriptional regulator
MNRTSQPKSTERAARRPRTRDRIDRAAYALFCRHGIRAVGVDALSARAGITKMTLYSHYPSKDALSVAFLRRRSALWTQAWLLPEIERRARGPRGRLLAVFDAFDEWFQRGDFEGCPFITALIEHGARSHPVRKAAVQHLAAVRALLGQLAAEAGIRDADGFARQWQILLKGSIVSALEGDRVAARRARQMGSLLLAHSAPERKGVH